MKAGAFCTVVLVAAGVTMARGQAASGAASPLTNSAAANPAVTSPDSLTNKATQVISKVRGVDPASVRIRWPIERQPGAFEIDVASAVDCRKEAEALSKEFGSDAVVIVDHVSPDGAMRTNWSFRNGVGRQVTAPVGATGLGPSAKRMYVWPQGQPRPAAPTGVRVRSIADEQTK